MVQISDVDVFRDLQWVWMLRLRLTKCVARSFCQWRIHGCPGCPDTRPFD